MNTELMEDEIRGALFGDSEPSTPAIMDVSALRLPFMVNLIRSNRFFRGVLG
jgi:hypothetical protein